jgi:hypothetical protein
LYSSATAASVAALSAGVVEKSAWRHRAEALASIATPEI